MQPGIHDGVREQEYHADRTALSQSQMKTILDCPARYKWDLDNPRTPTEDMEFGTVVHAITLGQPPAHVEIEVDSRRGKAWSAPADEARTEGLIPLMSKDVRRAEACAAAVRRHPYAGAMLAAEGAAEQTLRWDDPETGTPLRGRVDWLTEDNTGAPVLMDLKTTASVAGDGWGAHCARYGYHLQAAAYLDGFRALAGQDAAFIFVAVERVEPFFVRTFYATPSFISTGRERVRDALDIYVQCRDADHWPAYSPYPEPVDLPPWAA